MNRILIVAVAGLAVLGATIAQAAFATYKITKIDAATRTITLGNSQAYVLDASIKLEDWKVGDLVKVTYTSANGKNTATAIGKP